MSDKSERLNSSVNTAILIAVVSLVFGVGFSIYRVETLRERREATLESLRDWLQAWQRSDRSYARDLADRTQVAIDSIESGDADLSRRPFIYAAYITPSYDSNLNNAHVLTLLWLEDGFDVDGCHLYVNGELTSSLSGWRQQDIQQTEELRALFGNRYDRFRHVDVLTSESQHSSNNRDVVRLTASEIGSKLEVQLHSSTQESNRVRVLISEEVDLDSEKLFLGSGGTLRS